MKRASVESGHVDLYNDWNCRCQRTGRLSVGSEKKVPRKILKEGLWKACMEFVCVCVREHFPAAFETLRCASPFCLCKQRRQAKEGWQGG